MEARLRQALARAEEVARQLADPETARNPAKLKQLGREHARLDGIRQTHERLERLRQELAEAQEILHDRDPELSQLARADVERLRPTIELLERQLAELLTPTDPLDDRDAIVEVRAGTGGDEAALFAPHPFRMYTPFCERRGWKGEGLDLAERALGGLKETIFAARGPKADRPPRHQSGVERGAGDASPDRPRGEVPGPEIPAAEQDQGARDPAFTPARPEDRGAGGRARAGAARPGGHGRPLTEGPYLQLPAEPGHRPPHRVHHAQPRRRDAGRAR